MARGIRPDLLPQRLPSAIQLCRQDRNREGPARFSQEHGIAMQGARGLTAGLEEEQGRDCRGEQGSYSYRWTFQASQRVTCQHAEADYGPTYMAWRRYSTSSDILGHPSTLASDCAPAAAASTPKLPRQNEIRRGHIQSQQSTK